MLSDIWKTLLALCNRKKCLSQPWDIYKGMDVISAKCRTTCNAFVVLAVSASMILDLHPQDLQPHVGAGATSKNQKIMLESCQTHNPTLRIVL